MLDMDNETFQDGDTWIINVSRRNAMCLPKGLQRQAGSAMSNGLLTCQLQLQEQHAEMVAAVLKLRLRPQGTALIALAIRDEVCSSQS